MTNETKTHGDGFLGEALRKAGKGAGEIEAVQAVDNAQSGANTHRKRPGIVQEAFLSSHLPIELFAMSERSRSMQENVATVLRNCIEVVSEFVQADKVFSAGGALNPDLESRLTLAGFYGLTIPKEYGGAGASMHEVATIMLKLGRIGNPVIPGTLSIKTLIGPVGALKHYGTEEQKQAFLVLMAQVLFQGGFAGTEPSAGCNITKIKTYGVIEGNFVRIYGEKVFISRATYGAQIAVFLKIDGKFRVIKVDIPQTDTDEFQLKRYKLLVLQPALENNGLIFKGLRVPVANLLPGNGLEAIFKDLDDGRWAVGVSASILMSIVLASCPKWVRERETFGKPLATRQGIKYRMSLIAAGMSGAELLSLLTADSIDEERSGDLLAMITKIWSTNELRTVMTQWGIEVHGGRSFVDEHQVGSNILNALVATVYEGPNPMLAQAMVNALVKALRSHGLEDLAKGLKDAGLSMFELMPDFKRLFPELFRITGVLWKNKRGLFANRGKIVPAARKFIPFLYNSWRGVKHGKVIKDNSQFAALPQFEQHLMFAAQKWFAWRWQFIQLVFIYGEKLADEQILTEFEVANPLADIVAMFVAIQGAAAAAKIGDFGRVASLNMLCEHLTCRLAGSRPTSRHYRKAVDGAMEKIMSGEIRELEGIPTQPRIDAFFNTVPEKTSGVHVTLL